MQNKRLILKLIDDYISCARYMCNAIKEEYVISEHSLLSAYREKKIPKEGILQNNIYYNFHGGGCYFEFDNGTIDIDFGPNGRYDGFDNYRLYDFLHASKIKSEQYQELSNEEKFKTEFESLLKENVILAPGWYPNPNLFYLKETL